MSDAVVKLAEATEAENTIADEVERLKQEIAEAEAGAAVMREAAALESGRAAQLHQGLLAHCCALFEVRVVDLHPVNAEAARLRIAAELRERTSLLADAERVLQEAENAVANGNADKAMVTTCLKFPFIVEISNNCS